LTPVLSDAQTKEAVGKFEKILKDGKAKINNSEFWGMRKLAYPIQKKSTGFYQLTEFEGSGDVIEKLELAFRRDERILRFLTVKLDKHASIYAPKRIARLAEASKSKS
jgi:small subunit ribosomal protein S6